jgi:hypothetical protein
MVSTFGSAVGAAAESVRLEVTDGSFLPVDLPPPSATLGPSIFCFALHKSGSVMLDRVMLDLCRAVAVPAVSIDGICFRCGVPVQNLRPQSVLPLLARPGYCFYGFRGLHPFLHQFDLSQYRKIVVVRDPRDILISYFFSMKYSHSVPPAGETRANVLRQREAATSLSADEYVLSQGVNFIHNNFRNFIGLEGPMTKVFRYEDFVFEKRRWVGDINEWFGLGVSAETVAAIAACQDIFPEKEHPRAHIRQVTPGNYKKHLAPTTVAAIENRYRKVMEHYGYL